MKTLVFLTLLGLFSAGAFSRPVRMWSDRELLEQSDLVVIARPLSTNDTKERLGGSAAWPARIGVETEFEVTAVLKGEKTIKKVTLTHYRWEKASVGTLVIDGPTFLKFDLVEGHRYLLFLRREADERYTPFSGQTDPDVSIFKLEGASH